MAFHTAFAAALAVAWGTYLAEPAVFDVFGRFALCFFSLAWVVACSADLLQDGCFADGGADGVAGGGAGGGGGDPPDRSRPGAAAVAAAVAAAAAAAAASPGAASGDATAATPADAQIRRREAAAGTAAHDKTRAADAERDTGDGLGVETG
mmetsp:Transcript_105258/g.296390  ORF Transcript_105258/g.296390 Transcript_105258/m.296390 type:complete len:151 (+) Transcript_105258:488-940(+)